MNVYQPAKEQTAPFLMYITFFIAMDLAKPKPSCMQIIAVHRTWTLPLWYYLWRVMSRLHDSINYNFLLPGHTKCAPDWCFGLVKQKTRRTFISSLFDIARTVEDSPAVNVAELVGLHNGTVLIIATYNWVAYLGQYFKKVPQIKSFYHFRFDKEHPGTVFCKQYWDSEEKAVNLLGNRNFLPEPGQLLDIVKPQDFSRERADYLYKEIREFCCDGTENLVALQRS